MALTAVSLVIQRPSFTQGTVLRNVVGLYSIYTVCMWKGYAADACLLNVLQSSTLCYVAPVSSLLNCILIMLPLQYPPYNAPLFQN